MTVDDPFGVTADPDLPTLRRAVDPAAVQAILDGGVDGLAAGGEAELTAIRVIRHKPRRRCLIEYDLAIRAGGSGDDVALTAIGKVRRNRPGRHQLRLQRALWDAGFDAAAPDGISVPEPLGEIPALSMWLQRRVSGTVATHLIPGDRGREIAARLVGAAVKIHAAGVPARKSYSIADEMRILTDCLAVTASRHPELSGPIDALAATCGRAAASVPPAPATGIHRDFYPDQALVDGDRVTIVDFDLYTYGDPGLDIGNLLGHITEQALRERGDADALADVEAAAAERFASHAGPAAARSADLYAALTLARHVFLADERPERAHLVPALVELATRRAEAVTRS